MFQNRAHLYTLFVLHTAKINNIVIYYENIPAIKYKNLILDTTSLD